MPAYRKCRCGKAFAAAGIKKYCSIKCYYAERRERKRKGVIAVSPNNRVIVEGPCAFCAVESLGQARGGKICQKCHAILQEHDQAVRDSAKEAQMMDLIYGPRDENGVRRGGGLAERVRIATDAQRGFERHPLGYRPTPATIIGDK